MTIENATTNWPELMVDYNSVKNTNFKTPKEMLRAVYAKKQTYKKTGKVFLLSAQTILKYMSLWSLPCLPSGCRGESPCLRAIRALGDVVEFTAKEIAKRTGFSAARVGALMRKHKIKYNKLKNYGGRYE